MSASLRTVDVSRECPYCTSQVTLTVHPDGHIEMHHHEPYDPDCETRLWGLITEVSAAEGLVAKRYDERPEYQHPDGDEWPS